MFLKLENPMMAQTGLQLKLFGDKRCLERKYKKRFWNFVPKEWALDIIDKNEFELLNKLSEVF